MKIKLILLITFGLASLAQPLLADSEKDPEDIIKYRQDIMTIIKNHNSSIKAIVKGQVPFDDHLGMHIASLEKLFAELGRLFPEGSDFGDTSAQDAVWDQPARFSKSVKDAQQALSTFKSVAARGDVSKTAAAYKQFGKASCGSCHKAFKKKDE